MEPSIEVSWLWKVANGLALSVTAIIAYVWKRLDARVSDLERGSAGHHDIAELKAEIKHLSEKMDRYQEKLVEIVLSRQQ